MSRADIFQKEVLDKLSKARDSAEELKSELEQWLENMPENLQGGSKADELQEAIDELENCIGSIEEAEGCEVNFPGMF